MVVAPPSGRLVAHAVMGCKAEVGTAWAHSLPPGCMLSTHMPPLVRAPALVLQDMWQYKGALPERIFIGCGTAEYSATRDHERWGRAKGGASGGAGPGQGRNPA